MLPQEKAARCALREEARKQLRAAGIKFSEANCGGQMMVHHQGRTIDFWPGTGRWRTRSAILRETRRGGLQALLQYIQQSRLI